MALDAIHIRARSGSPQGHHDDDFGNADWQRISKPSLDPQATPPRSSLPPSRPSIRPAIHRPGIGSFSVTSEPADDDHGWRSLRTGESIATEAMRMRPRFVRATQLSDPSLQPAQHVAPDTDAHAAPLTESDLDQGPSSSSEPFPASAPTLAQLYSQLAQHMSTSEQTEASSSALPFTSISTDALKQVRTAEHPHHRRHHSAERQRSEWFISRALTKMRRSKEISSSNDTKSARIPADQEDETQPAAVGASRCPRCGDLLPLNPTQEDMARHRQSIGHRLGLNAPVSSASASEVPSPDASEAPTPANNSRSSSPGSVSLLDASMQALHRRSGRLPRRLSNAPRWKKISRDNVGHTLLSRMGWKEGMGLGVQEWKWQQLRREKVKRQRSNAVRALIKREAVTAQQVFGAEHITPPQVQVTEPEWMQLLAQQDNFAASAQPFSLQTFFPFQYDTQNAEIQREAAQAWLSNLAAADPEWFQCLTADEPQALEQALLAGQITLQEIQDAFLNSTEGHVVDNQTPIVPPPSSAATDDLIPSNALLYPVEVELRADRSGIGSRQPNDVGSVRHRRRSRVAEGSVEIRRPSSPSVDIADSGHKRLRSNPTERAPRPLGRPRSHSTSSGKQHAKQTDLTRRKREAAYRKEKQEWLHLRAPLS